MTASSDDTTTDLHAVIATLRTERDAALAREARRDTDYAERAAYQAATVEVLQAMAASPGDPKPVFELIVRRAHDLCDAYTASLAQVIDGSIVLGAYVVPDEGDAKGHEASFPRPVAADTMFGRAILAREPVQLPDVAADRTYALREGTLRGAVRAQAAVPLMRDGEAIGAINITRRQTGEFSQAQIELLQVFANQAVIAITSAETYRALEQRTAALAQRNSEYGERIEHQSATIDVLKAMSASPGDPQPVFDLIVERARDLCDAYGATVFEFDGTGIHWRAATGVSDDPAVRAAYEAQFPMVPTRGWAFGRAILDRRIIRIDDMEVEPGLDPTLRGITAKSNVTTPIMRGDEVIGAIGMGSREKGGFSDSQVELLKTFAEQAAIAITSAETYRALQARTSDLQETLEYQTATSDVLKVISRSTFDLQPVLSTVTETAARLCVADQAALFRHEVGTLYLAANWGFPPEYEARMNEIGRAPVGAAAQTVSHRAIIERRVIHIPDVAAVPGYPDPPIRLGRQRTSLGVPLLREGEPVGLILLARQRVEPFTDRQIDLVRTFADQAVIAIENTRLLNEQREALEQQTATAEVLQVINASPGNLAPVFEAVLEKALRLCEPTFGLLLTYDGECFHLAAQHEVPAAFLEFWESNAPLEQHGGGADRLLETKRPVQTLDVKEGEGYRTGTPISRALVDLAGGRTLLAVPFLKDGAVVGAILIYRREVQAFSDKQIALLENFAAQAVIAMENARLLTEQREALEQQTATAEVLQVINASPGDLAPVFQTILDKAMRLCEAAFGGLFTYDEERFDTVAALGTPAALTEFRTKNPPSTQPGSTGARLLETRRSHHILDRAQEPDYLAGDPGARAMVELGGARSMLNVPLLKEDKVLGFISLYRQEVRPFSDKQIALLESFAAQAVIAMENARLLSEIRQRQQELRITFENMGDGVAMFDETQRLVAWNGKFQEIFDLPDVLLEQHRTYEEHLRFLAARGDFGAGVDTAAQIDELVATTGQPYGYERRRPDGRVIEIRRNPVPDGGFVLIFSDITERKRSEAEIRAARDAAEEASRTIEAAYRDLKAAQANLIQAEKMASLGQLTAGIAHEIKNPLNFVNNFASLSVDLLDELKQTAAPGFAMLDETRRVEIDDLTRTLSGNLEKINEHGNRADGIVRSMLEHSRGSSGERRSVDLNVLVEAALNLAYHGARAQDQSFNITLQRDFGESIASITVVPQDVTRVLLNLFSNGFYAARRRQSTETAHGFEPTLMVATRELGEAVEIRVRDNGIGIPEEIRDKLFQPFFTTKPTGEGTGLGLSITYDIVTQQHGGTIAVESKVGEYSEFQINLPRRMAANEGGRA